MLKTPSKAIMYLSAGSPKDCVDLMDHGINDILVSYFYLRKRLSLFNEEILPAIKEQKGFFMADSGGFSFLHSLKESEEMYTEEYWLPFIEEYVKWIDDNYKLIYTATNLDLEGILGYDIIDKWNEKYFKPLEKKTNMVYVAHGNEYGIKQLIERYKDYCDNFDYIGVPSGKLAYNNASKFYSILGRYKDKRLHGFGWTSKKLLSSFPLFSVDSTTWLAGSQFGATFIYDGKNFNRYDGAKHLRKRLKLKCEKEGIDYNLILNDKGSEVNKMNILAWRGFKEEYYKQSFPKLRNKPAYYYDKRY